MGTSLSINIVSSFLPPGIGKIDINKYILFLKREQWVLTKRRTYHSTCLGVGLATEQAGLPVVKGRKATSAIFGTEERSLILWSSSPRHGRRPGTAANQSAPSQSSSGAGNGARHVTGEACKLSG